MKIHNTTKLAIALVAVASINLAASTSVFAAYVRPGTVTDVTWYEGACYATVSGKKDNTKIEGVSQSECETIKTTLAGMNIDTIIAK